MQMINFEILCLRSLCLEIKDESSPESEEEEYLSPTPVEIVRSNEYILRLLQKKLVHVG